jgi:hypothetical protein
MSPDTPSPDASAPVEPVPGEPVPNRQAGRELGAGDPAEAEVVAEVVATGDRRDEMHYEPDPDQLVVARFLRRPETPLPPDIQPADAVPPPPPEVSAVEDVRVAPQSPSVWDARPPPAEDAVKSGNPTGH